MFSNCKCSTLWLCSSEIELLAIFFSGLWIENWSIPTYGLLRDLLYMRCTVGLWNGFAIKRGWTEKVHNGLKTKIHFRNEHSNFHNKMQWAMEQLASIQPYLKIYNLFLKYQVSKIKFDELGYLSILNLSFTACVACKIQVWNRQKNQGG